MGDLQLQRFCNQYLQLDKLSWPNAEFLRNTSFQEEIYNRLFADDGGSKYQPPGRYQLRVLKELTKKIEESIVDWDEEAISDNLMNQLCKLLSQPLLSEAASAQQKSLVTYTISQLQQPQPAAHPYPNHKPEPSSMSSRPFPTISLLESRNLLFASGTTGLRTWEASLHLGNYLAWHPALIQGRSILELGAGTGYLSILCAKYLGAHAVLATDGSDGVVSSLATNIGLNDLESSARSSQSQAPFPSFPFSSLSQIISVRDLIWGDALLGTDDPVVRAGTDIDMVLGADVTYDDSAHEPLATTFNELLDRFPHVDILIAATERNAKTMRAFLRTCDEAGLVVHMVEYELVPRDQQMGPFYDDNVPIRLCFVKRKAGNEMGTPRERRDEHAVCTI